MPSATEQENPAFVLSKTLTAAAKPHVSGHITCEPFLPIIAGRLWALWVP
jgi:hypothetical protein